MIEKYRPSSGSEGMVFMEKWCGRCTKSRDDMDFGCAISDLSFAVAISDPLYPAEWVETEEGATCTAFSTDTPMTEADRKYLEWQKAQKSALSPKGDE